MTDDKKPPAEPKAPHVKVRPSKIPVKRDDAEIDPDGTGHRRVRDTPSKK